MAGKRSNDRWLRQLQHNNPSVRVEDGTKHTKIYAADGRLAGILPRIQRTERVSQNLISQLRRAGITV